MKNQEKTPAAKHTLDGMRFPSRRQGTSGTIWRVLAGTWGASLISALKAAAGTTPGNTHLKVLQIRKSRSEIFSSGRGGVGCFSPSYKLYRRPHSQGLSSPCSPRAREKSVEGWEILGTRLAKKVRVMIKKGLHEGSRPTVARKWLTPWKNVLRDETSCVTRDAACSISLFLFYFFVFVLVL